MILRQHSRIDGKATMENIFIRVMALTVFATAIPDNLVFERGQVDQCGFKKMTTLIHSLPKGRPVYGVQPYKHELYVIRDSTPYIEVYDSRTFALTRKIRIDVKGPYDMVLSGYYPASLFVVDWTSTNMTLIRVPEGTSSQWPMQEDTITTVGLTGSSAYAGSNILVTEMFSRKLKKFSPAGRIVSEMSFKNISYPRQSIQVGRDRYAVCQGYGPPPALHQVCLVDSTGETIKCHGTTNGSGPGQLNIPGRLERNTHNCILVADTGNKRVVLLTDELKYVKNLISSGLDGPYRLYIDEYRKRLYVADNKVSSTGIAVSGQVLIYKLE